MRGICECEKQMERESEKEITAASCQLPAAQIDDVKLGACYLCASLNACALHTRIAHEAGMRVGADLSRQSWTAVLAR